jgi:hypothetical protein
VNQPVESVRCSGTYAASVLIASSVGSDLVHCELASWLVDSFLKLTDFLQRRLWPSHSAVAKMRVLKVELGAQLDDARCDA